MATVLNWSKKDEKTKMIEQLYQIWRWDRIASASPIFLPKSYQIGRAQQSISGA
jgi:hypothetical protein